MRIPWGLVFIVWLVAIAAGCKKTTERMVPNNQAPWYDGVPTVLVENYVNRLFIDLLGREPIDSEMDEHVAFLRAGNLSLDARAALITRIQTDTLPVAGDSSYASVYYKRLYEQMKVRLLEGVSDASLNQEIGILRQGAVVDSLNGDSTAMREKQALMRKFELVLQSQWDYRYGLQNLDTPTRWWMPRNRLLCSDKRAATKTTTSALWWPSANFGRDWSFGLTKPCWPAIRQAPKCIRPCSNCNRTAIFTSPSVTF